MVFFIHTFIMKRKQKENQIDPFADYHAFFPFRFFFCFPLLSDAIEKVKKSNSSNN